MVYAAGWYKPVIFILVCALIITMIVTLSAINNSSIPLQMLDRLSGQEHVSHTHSPQVDATIPAPERVQVSHQPSPSPSPSPPRNNADSMWIQGRQVYLPKDIYQFKPVNGTTDWMKPVMAEEDNKKLLFYMDRYVEQVTLDCRQRGHMGSRFNGGYDVCLVEPYKPKSDCLVYSFGVGGMWSFESALVEEYGCFVRTFDPSRTMENFTSPLEHNIMFYPVGLGKDNTYIAEGKWPVKTLKTILKDFNEDNKIIDILKIDIDGHEWQSLATVFEEGVLPRVKQLIMEIHTAQDAPPHRVHDIFSTLIQLEKLGFRMFFCIPTLLGFSLYWSELMDMHRFCVHEIGYINLNFLDPNYDPIAA